MLPLYQDTSGPGAFYWQLFTTGLTIGGKSIFAQTTFTAVFQSTTEEIVIPGAEYDKLMDHMLHEYSTSFDKNTGTHYIEQSCPKSLNLTFTFGSGANKQNFDIPAKSFLRDLDRRCQILLVNGGFKLGWFILGQSFFRNYYVHFSHEKQQIGIGLSVGHEFTESDSSSWSWVLVVMLVIFVLAAVAIFCIVRSKKSRQEFIKEQAKLLRKKSTRIKRSAVAPILEGHSSADTAQRTIKLNITQNRLGRSFKINQSMASSQEN